MVIEGSRLRYVDTGSVIHRLDPRTKFILLFLAILVLFTVKSQYVNYFVFAAAMATYLLARLPWKYTRTAWFYVTLLGIIIAVMVNIVVGFQKAHYTVLYEVPLIHFKITKEGLITMVLVLLRLYSVASLALLLVYTVRPYEYSVAMIRMGLPHRLATAFDLALRYFPEMLKRIDTTIKAQMARGFGIGKGRSIFSKIAMTAPLIVPVTIGAVLNVYDIADAMELRCFGASRKIEPYRVIKMKGLDYLFLGLWLALAAFLYLAHYLLHVI